MHTTRRTFLKAGLAATAAPYVFPRSIAGAASPNERPVLGMIGCGGKGRDDANLASEYGDFAVFCDVDRPRAEAYASNPRLTDDGRRAVDVVGDYRRVLEQDDVDMVVCATPDHWHTKVYAEALTAGKHVYGEKPMTLTIDEVKILRRVVHENKAVFQVGNQQRSCQWFREAVAIAQSGALGGETITATCYLGQGRTGGPFQEKPVPEGLDWDQWLGQAPMTPYIRERCHNSFRWWEEYSGGKLTDWGAHHIDIALWAINGLAEGPVAIEGTGEYDDRPNCFNTAKTFRCEMTFANGNKLIVTDGGSQNGILFEGAKEHIFVNRGKLVGNLVGKIMSDEEQRDKIRAAAKDLYDGEYGLAEQEFAADSYGDVATGAQWTRVKRSHMANLFDCIRNGRKPISDVDTVGVSTMVCHLCNIAMRLGRPLQWDPKAEHFVGDDEADAKLARTPRKGYAVDV